MLPEELNSPYTSDPTKLTTDALMREIANLREFIEARQEERNRAIDLQFGLIESRRIELKTDTKAAIDAAFAAAEKAVAKTETTTTKQLEQLQDLVNTKIDELRRINDALEKRVNTIEAVKRGSTQERTGIYALAGFVLVVLSIAAIVASKL